MSAGRIYVVEDEAMIAMELCDRLQTLGYEVLGMASSGEQALREIAECKPDLLLLDIKLAGALSGVEVARGLRERQLDPAIVFLTAFSDDDLMRQASELEPAGYLVKPFDERELHATLQVAHFKRAAELERRRQLEQRRALEARLLRRQKHESLGRMAAAIAQSSSNACGGILGLLALAGDSIADPQQCAAYLEEASAEVQRAAELYRALR